MVHCRADGQLLGYGSDILNDRLGARSGTAGWGPNAVCPLLGRASDIVAVPHLGQSDVCFRPWTDLSASPVSQSQRAERPGVTVVDFG